LSYSCEYRIKTVDYRFRNGGDLVIWLELTNSVNVYIYSGTDRSNITTFIEGNSSAVVGAPYRVNLSDGAVIVAHAISPTAKGGISAIFNGTLNFSF